MHSKCNRCKMKLVILTKSTFFVEEDKVLAALFDEGMDNLHLYKPGSSSIFSERLLSLLPAEHHRKITIHDHFQLTQSYHLAGIHLDTPNRIAPEGYRGRISCTCTDLFKLREMRKHADYVFLKNIFDCIETKDETATFTIPQLEEAAAAGMINKKTYALGGITPENMSIMRSLGFGGVVVCGDLWNRFDVHSETDFKNIVTHFTRLRKAAG